MMFTDHSGLDEMVQVAQLNGFRSTTTRYGIMQSFWASAARPSTSTLSEVLEISFTDPTLINSLQFDLAKFPHQVQVQTFDEDEGVWAGLIEADGSLAARYVYECVPTVLPPTGAVQGHQHPQHSFAGHWQTEKITLRPVRVTRLRLVLTRLPAGLTPYDVFGNAVDYSLAVRNFRIGFDVRSIDDVPRLLPSGDPDGSYSTSFASSNDAVSSAVEYSLRTLGPERVLRDSAPDAVWRCEPQPDPDCVVNFFVDTRLPNGDPQVIDRIWIDPINNGAHITAYFAVDEAITRFGSPDVPLPLDAIDATEGISVTGGRLVLGATDSIILDNLRFNYDTRSPWWVGMVFEPQFDPGDVSSPLPLFDCGFWRLDVTATGLAFSTSSGDIVALDLVFQRGVPITAVVGYDGEQYSLWLSTLTSGDVSGQAVAAPNPSPITSFAIGSDLGRTEFGNSAITSLVIKQETPPQDGSSYRDDPRSFVLVDEYARNEPDTSRFNAVLRFDPLTALQSSAYPWCLFGGVPSRYEDLVWTPVPRDYTSQRGWMELPPTRARYWKLEFTHLPPIFSDVFVPVSQRVRRFPATEIAAYRARLDAADPAPTTSEQAHTQVVSHTSYDDTPVVVSTGGTDRGYTNTEVYLADDYSAAERLYAQRGTDWSYQQFIAQQSAPRFTVAQQHVYDTEMITRTSKVAYQVGLRSLQIARTTFSAKYDNPQYLDMLYDTTELDVSTNWAYDPNLGALTSGSSAQAVILSKSYESNRNVRGVQFAAQQSPPRQMLEDSEFDDPTASLWTAVGDATLGEVEDSIAFDHLLPVSRVLGTGRWEDIAPRYGGTWGGIMAAGATWGDLARQSGSPSSLAGGNGLVSDVVPIPAGGYVYAAARVIADRDLFAPLWLQIVDSVTGSVLAENDVSVRRGQVTEWYTTYELGMAQQGGDITWGELAGEQHLPSFFDLFTRPDSADLGRMNSGQFWQPGPLWDGTPGTSLALVSNTAAVTGAGQRSVVDVGTPWGKLVVVLGHVVSGATELIDFGGILVLGNGQVVDSETGQLYMTLTLADNDTLQFESMPTSQVPPAHTSGADASYLSWSIVITRNSTFVQTISFARALSPVRGLSGASGQTFTSFSWIPAAISIPTGTSVLQQPDPRDGNFDIGGTIWTESDGRTWFLDGSFTVSGSGIQKTLTAPAGVTFSFDTDVSSMFGALRTKIDITGGGSPSNSYYVLKLDEVAGYGLYLRADGHLVQFTSALGFVDLGLAASGYSSVTTVVFADTAKLSPAVIAAQSLSTSLPQTLLFLSGTTITSAWQGTNLWQGTIRGVMGDDGSTITGFTWSPNLGSVSTGSGVRTWDEVSGGGTLTWGEVAHSSAVTRNPVQLRVVQKIASQDSWKMDSAPLFIDPIVWEASNDNGQTWIPMSTIRNNPRGVALFGQTGSKLRYRITSYGRDVWLSHLVLRPWYTGHMRDTPIRPPAPHGPNLSEIDSYRPVEDDPNFMVWSLPIPREWWYAFRSLLPGITPALTKSPTITERSVI